jgi:pimeloyl-ACP methyl ester carboxylesterase
MSSVKRAALEGTVAVRDDRRLGFAEYGPRIIGIDRPGIGSSTPHLYPNILDRTHDLALLLDALAIDAARIIGRSGGRAPRAGCWCRSSGPHSRRRRAGRRGIHAGT